jgi:TRAP-type C4-dicarboxylate transport system permease large subunit
MGQTITEKILSRVMKRPVKAGETMYPEPIIMIVNLQIGVLMPPIGASALVALRMAGISFETQVRALVPFIAPGLVTLMFVTYIPQLSLRVPSYFGGR